MGRGRKLRRNDPFGLADERPCQTPASLRWAVGTHSLYLWQQEALSAWQRHAHRGIVEAVTGTGKTLVGIAAAADALEARGKVQVLVPTIELLYQWARQVRAKLPGCTVGLLGDGQDQSLHTCDILISVINSARREYLHDRLPSASLLIADECHRYGSEISAKALNLAFTRRLGMSATYQRSDDGNLAFLDPYFGVVCFRMDYRRAIADNVTAHFKVALVGVDFAPAENIAYQQATRVASDARSWLIRHARIPESPFGEFMKAVGGLAEGAGGQATWKARIFLQSFAEKRRVLAETQAKRLKLAALAPAVKSAASAIVFTQTIEAAEAAAVVLQRNGVVSETLHSGLLRDERRETLTRFGRGGIKAIVAPQVLDEGVDVPEADLAIILAASSMRRQMVQRMGRVLRRKADGRLARFAILYVRETSEDPALGAHEDFLEEVTSVADEVCSFASSRRDADLCRFLNDFRPSRAYPAPVLAVRPAGTTELTAPSAPVREQQRQDPRSLTKKQRDLLEAMAKNITVPQLIAARRDKAAQDAHLHKEAVRLGLPVKQLRRRMETNAEWRLRHFRPLLDTRSGAATPSAPAKPKTAEIPNPRLVRERLLASIDVQRRIAEHIARKYGVTKAPE